MRLKETILIIGIMILAAVLTAAEESADLSELAGSPDFFSMLQQEYSSESDPEEALQIIRTYLPIVRSGDQRHRLLLDMARLEEQLHKLQSAQLHYQSAAFAPGDTPDFRALFMSALLLIDFAEYDQALLQCRRIIRESDQERLRRQARLQEARILQLQDESTRALESLDILYEQRKSVSAEILYGMYSLYSLIDAEHNTAAEKAREVAQIVKQQYPNSPENELLEQKIFRTPTPETALGLSTAAKPQNSASDSSASEKSESNADADPDGDAEKNREQLQKSRAIQTGSFRDAENAHYMQRELEKQGFTAMVTQTELNGTSFFRVLVPIAYGQTEQEIVLQLKEKGFEGYPIY